MTETELCAEFMAWARGEGHRCYPEWLGWDILVETSDGTQIGVEAKTGANLRVLVQALRPYVEQAGPNYHSVLVPKAGFDFNDVARRLNIWVIDWSAPRRFGHTLPIHATDRCYRWDHPKLHRSPPVEELGRPAGVPSPSSLTPWKISAIKLLLVLERRGYVTSLDFKALGLSMGTTWVGRWIKWDGTKEGRRHRFVAIAEPRDPRPDQLHPEVAKALRGEDVRKP